MPRLIDIETVITRTIPCLTVLNHVWFILEPYWTYCDCINPCVHSWNGLHVWLYVRSHTISHDLSRSCTIAYTIIHGHDTRASFFKSFKNHTRLSRTHSNSCVLCQTGFREVASYTLTSTSTCLNVYVVYIWK